MGNCACLKFADSEMALVGIPDAQGVIRGEFVHKGLDGGSFVLTPKAVNLQSMPKSNINLQQLKPLSADTFTCS